MTERAEQLVLEYLAKASDAAQQYLLPTRRTAYVADLRDRIDAARAKGKGDDDARVRQVLRRFGDPVALVAREVAEKAEAERAAADSGAADPERTTHAVSGKKPKRSLGRLAQPVRLERDPPPWRGGPKRSRLRRRADIDPAPAGGAKTAFTGGGGSAGGGGLRENSPAMLMLWFATAARRYPMDVFSIALYLVSGLITAIAFVWVIGAVQVVLSSVWEVNDKWVAVGVPVAATAIGMALWQGNAPFIDQVILESLLDTGLIGLRIGVAASAVVLAVRIARIARSEGA
ncbi:hypothetical protein CLV63_103397 [Murinocardiopsis flavida]|uniref:Uncharacterized protein n=1 Tax=Murinocardiopsis flavida TaxID=645275 RepID=A0A2P8DR33_9ACTN|nr:hypothetical protein [Murinocardiopsis flavida]PSK99670.1 hypothetical protein CLV63_103397 [Murinocardiopsis flavida]